MNVIRPAVLILVNHDVVIYNFRLELVKKLLNDGYEVHISSPRGEHTKELIRLAVYFHEIKINRHGMNPKDEAEIFFEYRRLIKQVHPVIILAFTVKPDIYGGIAARAARIPFIANITGLGTAINNGGAKRILLLLLYKFGLWKARKVFFQNEENKNFMMKHHLVSSPYTVLPGSGVNLKVHCLEPYPEETEKLVFTTIGRIMKDKGTDELLIAAEEIKKLYPQVTFRLIGFFDDDYESRIGEAQRKGIIEYFGQQRNIHSWIAGSHAIIHPSYHEGMSNVLLEAAAAGRPILASAIPGCRETFQEGKSGLGFLPKCSSSLVRVIKKFIKLDHAQKAAMGIAGRKIMERQFSRDIVVDEYMKEIYRIMREE